MDITASHSGELEADLFASTPDVFRRPAVDGLHNLQLLPAPRAKEALRHLLEPSDGPKPQLLFEPQRDRVLHLRDGALAWKAMITRDLHPSASRADLGGRDASLATSADHCEDKTRGSGRKCQC